MENETNGGGKIEAYVLFFVVVELYLAGALMIKNIWKGLSELQTAVYPLWLFFLLEFGMLTVIWGLPYRCWLSNFISLLGLAMCGYIPMLWTVERRVAEVRK